MKRPLERSERRSQSARARDSKVQPALADVKMGDKETFSVPGDWMARCENDEKIGKYWNCALKIQYKIVGATGFRQPASLPDASAQVGTLRPPQARAVCRNPNNEPGPVIGLDEVKKRKVIAGEKQVEHWMCNLWVSHWLLHSLTHECVKAKLLQIVHWILKIYFIIIYYHSCNVPIERAGSPKNSTQYQHAEYAGLKTIKQNGRQLRTSHILNIQLCWHF